MPRTVRIIVAAALAAAALPALGTTTHGAAGDDPLYRPVSGFKPTGAKVRVVPDHYSAVRIDLDQVRGELDDAPKAAADDALVFEVPTPAGETERFAVHRTRTMEAELAAAHPEIQTYAGRSLEHDDTTIALDVTPLGFHAAVRGPHGQRAWYVDPAYDRPGTRIHLSYYGGAVPRAEHEFVERQAPEVKRLTRQAKAAAGGGPVTRREYRLAFLTDPSYFNYYGSDPGLVLAAKNTLVNRVNQIYNDDLAIRMVLIDDTEELSLETEAEATGPNGPCGAHRCFDLDPDPTEQTYTGHIDYCDVGTLGRNRIVLGQLVGASSYDIGHIGLGKNGGGIAYLGVVGADFKGGGCTGLPKPQGDFYAIDYVAHEFGHQYAGNHTFSACGAFGGNGRTGLEPGSGSTVMAYAGICGHDDLQPHTDPYFSAATVDEVRAYTRQPTEPVVEVQTVSLTGFDTNGDNLTLGFGGATKQIPFAAYSSGSVESAVENLTGQNVTIAQWSYDPYAHDDDGALPVQAIDRTGFQVIFAPSPDPLEPEFPKGVAAVDQPPLVVTGSAGVTADVGETAQGGAPKNDGHDKVPAGNRAPTVKAPSNKTIPTRTPFTLEGSAKDADGQSVTLLWEQTDWTRNPIPLTSNTKRSGPLFRVFGEAALVSAKDALQSPSPGQNRADGNGSRTFPDLAQVLEGNTNAKTGKCPRFKRANDQDAKVPRRLVDCYSEFLPTKVYQGSPGQPRKLHFRLTARDGFHNGGGLGHDSVTLRVAPKAGPFLVTSFMKGGKVRPGSTETVTWKVNGTKRLAKSVRIWLSTNGGKTWKALKKSTANDGRAKVWFPRKKTSRARLMISANGNYFFDVNDKEFRIRR